MFKDKLLGDLKKAVEELGFKADDTLLSIPKNSAFGDYTTNVALQLAKLKSTKGKQNPDAIAKKISAKMKHWDYLEKIEVAPTGFINFFINPKSLMESLHQVCNYSSLVNPELEVEGSNRQKIFVEYAGFNALKPVHVGHLRNITLGESIARLLEAKGHEVFRATYTSDIGLPAAKVVWAILQSKEAFTSAKKGSLREKAEFLGKLYVKGNTAFEENEKAKAEIDEINTKIYQRDSKLVPIWQEALAWTFEYFASIYSLVGTKFDKEFLESEAEGVGREIVKKNTGEIFREDSGAVIFPGEEFGLHNRVFITSVGNPTYEAKEMGLAKLEYEAFNFDKSIHVVANDQDDYFKVVFKALDFIDHDLASRERHLSYGYVTLPSGKMSSRKGNVVTLEEVYDLVQDQVEKKVKETDLGVAEKAEVTRLVSMGALKFAILKFAPQTDITFDLEKSVSLSGDSGPYVQYSYARAKSVLRNASYNYLPTEMSRVPLRVKHKLENEERKLLRSIEHFESIISEASKNHSPNLLASFLLDLASSFNLFYQKHPIMKSEQSDFRLALTCAVAVILKQGLYLLGIEAPERM